MGTQSQHQDSRSRLEEINQDGKVRSEGGGHLLVENPLKMLLEAAYQKGFEDGMTFISQPSRKGVSGAKLAV
jgi:hypothetical protein